MTTDRRSRRDFLKTSGAGAAALALAPRARAGSGQSGAWTDGMQINPAIDNLRVVCCEDPAMITDLPTRWGMAYQSAMTDNARVGANLDAMACALAGETDAGRAWQAIFRTSKSWSQTIAAIKVNTINANNMPRVAVLGKLCQVLIDLGVPAGQVIIYDSCTNRGNADPRAYEDYIGAMLPAGVTVSNYGDSLGGDANEFAVPGFGDHRCVEHIADGTVDILINCAVNKGHSRWNGNCTLCMKNHYGTFAPDSHSDVGYITGINKSEAIVGGAVARQQLCVVDSLVAGSSGPGGAPDQRLDRLVMGTFAGAVDYLTAVKIREEIMGVTANDRVPRFLTDFGYQHGDFADLDFISVPPYDQSGVDRLAGSRAVNAAALRVRIESRRHAGAVSVIAFDRAPAASGRVDIFDSAGSLIRSLRIAGGRDIVWDGKNRAGRAAARGTYLLTAVAGAARGSARVTLR